MVDTRNGAGDESLWPDELLEAGEVRKWIASALPGSPSVAAPEQVYQAKEWGVTARFTLTWPRAKKPNRNQEQPARSSGRPPVLRQLMTEMSTRSMLQRVMAEMRNSVVFKASLLPLFTHAPRVYSLLTRHCPGIVPELLAWAPVETGAWMLFAPFDGISVSALPGLEPLVGMVRSLADIQDTVSDLPESETSGIPHVPPRDLPAMFAGVLADIRARHLAFWRGEGRELAEQFALPNDVDEQLERYQPRIVQWAAELEVGSWPLSLDHVDLQSDNAMLRPDGRVLLLDWEEANLSVPFFSLDRLLDDARERGGEAGEAALRAVYLDALPWGTRPARERALTLALRLAPLKHAYEGMRLADALGWEEGMPHVTAWAVARMLARWATIG
jgi:hypothetical protein